MTYDVCIAILYRHKGYAEQGRPWERQGMGHNGTSGWKSHVRQKARIILKAMTDDGCSRLVSWLTMLDDGMPMSVLECVGRLVYVCLGS